MTFKDFIEAEEALLAPNIKLLAPSSNIKKKHMKRMLDIGTLKKGVFKPYKTLGIPRAEMPQIKNREEFISWLVKERGIKVERIINTAKNLVQPSGNQTLAHAQQVMHLDKAEGIINRQKLINKKIILSQDNIIFDGNHHWFALMLKCPKCPVEMYKVDMPFQELLTLSREFPGITYEEQYSFANFVDLREGLLQNLTGPTIWGLIQWAQNLAGIPEGSPIDMNDANFPQLIDLIAAQLHVGKYMVRQIIQSFLRNPNASINLPSLPA